MIKGFVPLDQKAQNIGTMSMNDLERYCSKYGDDYDKEWLETAIPTREELLVLAQDIKTRKEKKTMENKTQTNNTLLFVYGGKKYAYQEGLGVNRDKFVEKMERAQNGNLNGRLPGSFANLVVDGDNNETATTVKPQQKPVSWIEFQVKYGDNEITVKSKEMLEAVLEKLESVGIEPVYNNPNETSADPLESMKANSDPLANMKTNNDQHSSAKSKEKTQTEHDKAIVMFASHVAGLSGYHQQQMQAILKIMRKHSVRNFISTNHESFADETFERIDYDDLPLLEQFALQSINSRGMVSNPDLILKALESGEFSHPIKCVFNPARTITKNGKTETKNPWVSFIVPKHKK